MHEGVTMGFTTWADTKAKRDALVGERSPEGKAKVGPHRVEVTRDGDWWMLRIPGMDGVNGIDEGLTQARTREDIERMACDYIASILDCDPAVVEVDIKIEAEWQRSRH